MRLFISAGLWLFLSGWSCLTVIAVADQTESVSAEQLAAQMESGELQQRRDAVYALSAMGTDALPALPALLKGLEHSDEQIRAQSVTAVAL